MRRLRFSVATSLDGFIAGPNGEYDWIIADREMDFTALYKQFDTALMGRRTFEMALQGPGATMPGMQTIVCSRTLRQQDHPDVTIVADAAATAKALQGKPGKDIWLFGGANLFRSLLDARLVDSIELKVMPVLLSQGIPLLPSGQRSPHLQLTASKMSPAGIASLNYSVDYGPS
jgi:dihydrofolate reductase